jgi:hypothetical protein
MVIPYHPKLRLLILEDVIRVLKIMEVCPCSPDVGDCSKCKPSGGNISSEDLPDGGKRKWIQDVVAKMKKGSFTKQAVRKHMNPEELAIDVAKHPKKYALKTRRRAQFFKNIQKSPRKTSRRK